jgi:hypothetical protein
MPRAWTKDAFVALIGRFTCCIVSDTLSINVGIVYVFVAATPPETYIPVDRWPP